MTKKNGLNNEPEEMMAKLNRKEKNDLAILKTKEVIDILIHLGLLQQKKKIN